MVRKCRAGLLWWCAGGSRANEGPRSHATLVPLQHEARTCKQTKPMHTRPECTLRTPLVPPPHPHDRCDSFERTAQQTTTPDGSGGHRGQDGGIRHRRLRGTSKFPCRVITRACVRRCDSENAQLAPHARSRRHGPRSKSSFIRAKPHPRRLFRSLTDKGHGGRFRNAR